MTIFCDVAEILSGTTVDTFGTAGTIVVNSKAKRLIGIISQAIDTIFTTAEGSTVRLRINSTGVPKLTNLDFQIPALETSGPATNSSGQSALQDVTPIDFPLVGNETISFDAAPTTTITTARQVEVGLLYSDGNVPADIYAAIGNDCPVPIGGSATVDASQLTVVPTALSAITVPGWAREIIACRACVYKTGAITTGEWEQGFFSLTGTIADMGVQKYPLNGLGSTLGTPVGTGMYESKLPWLPMHIPTPGKDITITPQINLRHAVTTANRVAFTLAWR